MSKVTQGQFKIQPTSKRQTHLSTGCYTARGQQREHNEDACAHAAQEEDQNQFGTLLVVADGVGGMPGGAVASQQAVQDLRALYYAGFGPSQPADRLRQCAESANALNHLLPNKPNDRAGYLTTLVAAVVWDDQIWIANVGDSRAYLVQSQQRRRVQLTEDHSRETQMVKRGLTGDHDVLHQEGVITRAVGLEERCQVDTYHYTWLPGDRLVLCSDGLTQLSEEDMVALTLGQPANAAAKRLVERAEQVDGSDNCTAAVAAWDLTAPVRGKSKPGPTLEPEPKASATYSTSALLPLLLGLLIGWSSAAIIIAIWLDATGILDVF